MELETNSIQNSYDAGTKKMTVLATFKFKDAEQADLIKIIEELLECFKDSAASD